MVNFAQAGK